MRKFSSISKNDEVISLAIGKFDSMHLAHQAIIKHLSENDIIILIKMPPHINGFIVPYRRREYFAKRKICFVDFMMIKDLSGKDFLSILGSKFPNLKHIVIGNDFCFGKDRQCRAIDIPQISPFKPIIMPEIIIDNIPVHSSFVRKFILEGKIDLANKLLGRFYSIDGEVVSGQGIGREELFPTLNIEANEYVLPQNGVYASYTKIESKYFKSITFVGNHLSTNMTFAIETHILGESLSIPPQSLEIFFVQKLRDNQKFDNLKSLKSQIALDIDYALCILEDSPKGYE